MCKINNLTILYIVIFLCGCWGAFFAFFYTPEKYDNSTLEIIHVLMRHGDRHPDKVSVCPSSPFYDEKYYPEGYGQLNNAGKRREYEIGRYLRNRYSDFLGPTWNIKHLEARSSDYNRTKMSLQLALAGLFPPTGSEVWSPLYWQPIPYIYVPKLQDKEILPYYTCPRYKEIFYNLCEEPSIKKYLQGYDETFKILSNRCNRTIDVEQAFILFIGFKIQEELGYSLEEWIKTVYPQPLHSVVIDMYYLMANTTEIKQIISGYFLKKILTDTQAKINGTIQPPERKMFIYSGHEMNLATLLITLGTQDKLYEIPPYGAFILFEVHKIDGVYGIKIFYQNYKQEEPIPLKIQGCDYFCPYDEFYRILETYLPASDAECYGNSTA